ncbi:VOC family protein [Phyllobacterium lublinensis]|uniref:VOC family protein n=1 Tax=Phyllobacterium lublinensis TaxID=2875708 RepID=UPI001CC9F58A|nr:VOC family protein [Phyllobacterium sp. 2063]MBZ9654998.1 VOC family protein [Phyllobacterium sp. 2063]
MSNPANFIWYELLTSDAQAAEQFYRGVVRWDAQDAGNPDMQYTLLTVNQAPVAGLMAIPESCGADMKPAWSGIIWTDDIDAKTAQLKELGGKVLREPDDIPNIGRFAAVADPQGAPFQLFQPSGEQPDSPKPPTPGTIGWHELNSSNWENAFTFYSKLFGWTKDQAMDMGPMGTYQLFAAGGDAIGGMMNSQDPASPPNWQFYFCVDNITAAEDRVKSKGGQILFGPQEVPGDAWILQCQDPQGAVFCLVGPRS